MDWFKTPEQVERKAKEDELQRVENNRRNAYQKEADPLFFKWQRGEIEKKEYDDKVKEVRQRIPKPE